MLRFKASNTIQKVFRRPFNTLLINDRKFNNKLVTNSDVFNNIHLNHSRFASTINTNTYLNELLSNNEEILHWKRYMTQINRNHDPIDDIEVNKRFEVSDLKQITNLLNKPIILKNDTKNINKHNKVNHNKNNKNNSVENEKENERDENIDRNNENNENVSNESNAKSSSATNSNHSSSSSTPPNSNGGNDDGNSSSNNDNNVKDNHSNISEIYPQMLALPISRRPLFPGFYKAVVISDERVMKAIQEMLERQQPYVGAFMLRDSERDTDVIENVDDVYDVGVLAQITSAFPSKDEKTGKETMTALLYPHRRIKLNSLIPPKEEEIEENIDTQNVDKNHLNQKQVTKIPKIENIIVEKVNEPQVHSNGSLEKVNSEVAKMSVDKETPTSERQAVVKNEGTETQIIRKQQEDGEDIENPTEFLKDYNVSLVNISNLEDEPFNRKSPIINALTSEILKVFKEISQLNTMFREQIATFSASIQSATTNIFEEPARLADFAAAVSAGEEEELQDILSSLNIEHRLEKSLLVLKKELMNAELQNKISKDVETKIQKRQREYYLMEQLKGIKRELGIDDGRDKLIETYKQRSRKGKENII